MVGRWLARRVSPYQISEGTAADKETMSSPLPPNSDPYTVLGVTPDMPFAEVRAVHRRLVRELHPDVNPGARDRFDAVQSAFELLRAQHAGDRRVAGQPGPSALDGVPLPGLIPPFRHPPISRIHTTGLGARPVTPATPRQVLRCLAATKEIQPPHRKAARVQAGTGPATAPSMPRSGAVQGGAGPWPAAHSAIRASAGRCRGGRHRPCRIRGGQGGTSPVEAPSTPRSGTTGLSGAERSEPRAAPPRSGAVRAEAAAAAGPDDAALRG